MDFEPSLYPSRRASWKYQAGMVDRYFIWISRSRPQNVEADMLNSFSPNDSIIQVLPRKRHPSRPRWTSWFWKGCLCCLPWYWKAFDSVPHAPLMKKLQDIGLHANLLVWLFDYLTLISAAKSLSSQEFLKAQCCTLTVYSIATMSCCIVVFHNHWKNFLQCSWISTS